MMAVLSYETFWGSDMCTLNVVIAFDYFNCFLYIDVNKYLNKYTFCVILSFGRCKTYHSGLNVKHFGNVCKFDLSERNPTPPEVEK